MTNKEALQSLTEYSNNDLIEKLLLDRGVVTGAVYTAGNAEIIDLCASDLYFTLATHPELREGAFAIKFSGPQLIAMGKRLLRKHGEDEPNITGNPVW